MHKPYRRGLQFKHIDPNMFNFCKKVAEEMRVTRKPADLLILHCALCNSFLVYYLCCLLVSYVGVVQRAGGRDLHFAHELLLLDPVHGTSYIGHHDSLIVVYPVRLLIMFSIIERQQQRAI